MKLKGRHHGKLLVSGFVTLTLAVIILVTFIVGQNTGQRAVLAEAFVDRVSNKVTDQLDSDVTSQIADKVMTEKMDSVITPEYIKQLLDENVGGALSDEQKVQVQKQIKESVTQVLTTSAADERFLSDEQQAQVKKMIKSAISTRLANKDVNSLTDADIDSLRADIEADLGETLKDSLTTMLGSTDITFSKGTLDKIEKSLNVTSVVKEVLKNSDTVVKEKELKTIQNDIVKTVQQSVKTPVKGTDYMTADEIASIESGAASKAADKVSGDISSVKTSVATLESNVNLLQTQISTLSSQIKDNTSKSDTSLEQKIDQSKQDSDKKIDDTKNELNQKINDESKKNAAALQASVLNINQSITTINETANELGGKIDVRNSFLRRITSQNGSISKAEVVDTSNMSIAEYVGVISGNEKEYTSAINQLAYLVDQIDKKIGENFKSLSKECASLSASIDANGDNITSLSEALELESQRRQKAIEGLQTSVSQDMTDVRSKLESYKSASEAYANEQSDENKKALDAAKKELEKSLTDYKGNLNDLSSQVNGIDNATQGKIDNINEQIQAALDSIANGDGALEEKITSLSGSTSEFITSLQQTVRQETTDRINADIELKEELNKNIQSGIQGVNDAMTALDEAQKAYTDNASAENEKALKDAKEALQNALASMNESLSGDIGKLDDATKEKIEVVKGNIGDINEKLAADALDIGSLQEGVNGLTKNLGTVSSDLDRKITEEKLNRELAIKSLAEQMEEKLNSQISDVNKAMEKYNEAQKAYTDSATEENKKALSDAKAELSASISNVQQLLSSDISALSQNSKDAIDKANQTIASVQKILSGAETDIDALQTGVGELQTNLSDVNTNLSNQIAAETAARNLLKDNLNKKIEDEAKQRKNLENTITGKLSDMTAEIAQEAKDRSSADSSEAKARADADKAINNTIGNASDASSVSGSTIFAKIKTIWAQITDLVTKQTNLEKKVNDTDQWCANIVLKNLTGTNSGKNVYYENVTSGTHNGGIRWKVEGSKVGVTNLKATSQINLQYASATPDIVCEYEQASGYFYIYVDKDYKTAALSQDITIEMMHVESAQ